MQEPLFIDQQQVYKGSDEILLSKLILDPTHSILKQSFDSRLRLVCCFFLSTADATIIHATDVMLGHAARPEQRRWLRHRLLHRPKAGTSPMPLHLHDPCLELHESTTNSLQDGFSTHLRPCPRHDRGLPHRRQLPSIHPRKSDVDA